MNRYEPSMFRPAFGVAAAALSAVTLAAAVVFPLSLACGCPGEATLAGTPSAIEVSINPAKIDVVGEPVRTVMLSPVYVVARRSSQAT
jgi:hypothetical protein